MSKPLLNLFFLSILLTILSTTLAYHHHPIHKHPKPTPNFIWSSCLSTRYPPLCFHSLKSYGSKIGRSQRQLTLAALAVSLSKARSAVGFVSQVTKVKGIKRHELEAVKDCIDTMSDSVDQLSQSFEELANLGHTNGEDFMWHMSNVQTWVSAALTDETTCVDGFSDGVHENSGKIKSSIQVRVNNVAQVTSNALALVNKYVDRFNGRAYHVKSP
ncbi:pectinesterase inhibitor 9-like [Amaranthus tricolor]|uniref:pectinesterase inhibitor 9-like n=1 Tax=Amaranthus tricolor TaxID=29722 RepID=UPI002586D838|nr:pectinesterase inhibitor 9-like [Amaranthus tricolor]